MAIARFVAAVAIPPNAIINAINMLICSFIWEGGNGGSKLHLVCSEWVARPQNVGGLGITSFEDELMMGQQRLVLRFTRLHREPILWIYIMNAKYLRWETGVWDSRPWQALCQHTCVMQARGWWGLEPRALLTAKYPRIDSWQRIWQGWLPEKVKIFLWLLRWDTLPVRALLRWRGILQHDTCPSCGAAAETVQHFVFDCECMRAAVMPPQCASQAILGPRYFYGQCGKHETTLFLQKRPPTVAGLLGS